MQSFNTADSRHAFAIDGREFYLPSPTIEDALGFSTMEIGEDVTATATMMRDLLVLKARPARRKFWDVLTGRNPAVKAINNLGVAQTSAIFTGWATSLRLVSLGESSGSAE